jgi:hypothetical protein
MAGANAPFPQVKGVLTQIKARDVHTNIDVPFPPGVAVDKENNVYVSAWSISTEAGIAGPGTDGQVWRLRFRPRPARKPLINGPRPSPQGGTIVG